MCIIGARIKSLLDEMNHFPDDLGRDGKSMACVLNIIHVTTAQYFVAMNTQLLVT